MGTYNFKDTQQNINANKNNNFVLIFTNFLITTNNAFNKKNGPNGPRAGMNIGPESYHRSG